MTKIDVAKSFPLLLCLDPVEFSALQKLINGKFHCKIAQAPSDLFQGEIHGSKVWLLRLPFGDKIEALLGSLSQAIMQAAPSEIFVVGTAMALSDSLKIGDFAITQQTSTTTDRYNFNESLIEELFYSACHGVTARIVRGYSSDVFIDTKEQKSEIIAKFPETEILEMEDAHIARLAKESNIPCCSIRIISDFGSFEEHMRQLPIIIPELIKFLARLFRIRMTKRFLKEFPSPLTKLPFHMYLRTINQKLLIPQATSISKTVCSYFRLYEIMKQNSEISIFISDKLAQEKISATFSGKGSKVSFKSNWQLLISDHKDKATIWLDNDFIGEMKGDQIDLEELSEKILSSTHEFEENTHLFIKTTLPLEKDVHIQGLNSISAEAEEGLLAAATCEEFKLDGFNIKPAESSRIWIYRTANSSEESYFSPDYHTPHRPRGILPNEVYCIATGLGPVLEPEAAGGAEAATLVLGDEQGGRLVNILEDLASSNFSAREVFKHKGVIQRIALDAVAISRIDRRFVLTTEGLNQLTLCPESLRQVYSEDYDLFLKEYFAVKRRPHAAKGSFLLLTSRGCGNECSICCSGGFIPFTPLSPTKVADILQNLKDRFSLQNNEYLDVYFLDSNFNKAPERVSQLLSELQSRDLLRFFEFFIRHNGLQGFLRNDSPDKINTDLIKAYKGLGIDEIVIGIDSYTDSSIQLLKTSFQLLKTHLSSQAPSYSFTDIKNVVKAIEAQGMTSRGFLLMRNPFVGPADRLKTFYNLLNLGLDCPGFVIDSASSQTVNELKPFPGAPITIISQNNPELMEKNKFKLHELCHEIESRMRFDIFLSRRDSNSKITSFIASTQETRFGLGDYLCQRIQNLPEDHHGKRNELGIAAHAFLNEEKKLAPIYDKFTQNDPFLLKRENEIVSIKQKLDHELSRREYLTVESETPEQTLRFFKAIENLE